MTHDKIIGKTLTFTYENDTYRIEIKSKDRLHWEQLRGDNPARATTRFMSSTRFQAGLP